MATCNPNTLLAQAAAFQACDDRMLDICIIQLLCNIASSGTGGPATSILNTTQGKITPIHAEGANGNQFIVLQDAS